MYFTQIIDFNKNKSMLTTENYNILYGSRVLKNKIEQTVQWFSRRLKAPVTSAMPYVIHWTPPPSYKDFSISCGSLDKFVNSFNRWNSM